MLSRLRVRPKSGPEARFPAGRHYCVTSETLFWSGLGPQTASTEGINSGSIILFREVPRHLPLWLNKQEGCFRFFGPGSAPGRQAPRESTRARSPETWHSGSVPGPHLRRPCSIPAALRAKIDIKSVLRPKDLPGEGGGQGQNQYWP